MLFELWSESWEIALGDLRGQKCRSEHILIADAPGVTDNIELINYLRQQISSYHKMYDATTTTGINKEGQHFVTFLVDAGLFARVEPRFGSLVMEAVKLYTEFYKEQTRMDKG